MNNISPDYVRYCIDEEKLTLAQVAEHLQKAFPNNRGFSERSIKRFCTEHGIDKQSKPLTKSERDNVVADAVVEVGGQYGRRMLYGHLKAKGVQVGERQLRDSLSRVHPYYHQLRRRGTEKQFNPATYYAPYCGYNLHLDQNEKLVMFGVTFVLSVDGKSCFIPSYGVMPIKNNITIYRDVYCAAVSKYGLWEQLIVDHGTEFNLTLFMQHFYRDREVGPGCGRKPYRQVQSVRNNRVERLWVEVNQRVGFPLKTALIDFEQTYALSAEDPEILFCISTVTCMVAQFGLRQWVNAWNSHHVTGKGSPESYLSSRKNFVLDASRIMEAQSAADMYAAQGREVLTTEHCAGTDPLFGNPEAQQTRNVSFTEKYGLLSDYLFSTVVNGDYTAFHGCILDFLKFSNYPVSFENQ